MRKWMMDYAFTWHLSPVFWMGWLWWGVLLLVWQVLERVGVRLSRVGVAEFRSAGAVGIAAIAAAPGMVNADIDRAPLIAYALVLGGYMKIMDATSALVYSVMTKEGR